jgi:argininosuccinate lyase
MSAPETPVSGRLWGGGFAAPPDPRLDAYCASFAFDVRLLPYDLRANRAWVSALAGAGVLAAPEAARLDAALRSLEEEARAGTPPAGHDGGPAFEDVHSYVEARLARIAGPDLAGRLRTGRSRNDLVATDLRLFARDATEALRRSLRGCVGAAASLAERAGDLAVPGYTHMRRAQPILLAHAVLLHAERLMRDDDRFAEAAGRADVCPLGSGALAGTTAPVDREALARSLGFSRVSAHSLDAVSDRDFVADLMYACTLAMIHLSQAAEDLILATAEELGWLRLDDAAATGSSLMPQKKNPDVLELLRGRAGRVLGRHAGFLATLKGLPAAYNRDLQEDKEALFESCDATGAGLEALAVVFDRLEPVPARGLTGATAGDLTATDLADYLAGRGLPFAEAHRLAGELSARARRDGRPLADLPLEVLREIAPPIEAGVRDWLDHRTALRRRAATGGTAPERVAEGLARARAFGGRRHAGG